MKKPLPLCRVYRLLEPGPVVLVTTAEYGRANVMTLSWHTMLDFEPPLVGCVIDSSSHTFHILQSTGQCVINIPAVKLARQTVGCGNTSGRNIDKFKVFGLTPESAMLVAAPLIAECYANLECRLADAGMADKYNFFVLEVLCAWIDPEVRRPKTMHHRGKGEFMVAGRTIRLPSRMK